MKPAQQNLQQSVIQNPTTPTSKQVAAPVRTQFKYGNMTIPPKLVFYEKSYVYAMVPLAQKLQARMKMTMLYSITVCRYHACPKETSFEHEGFDCS